MSLLAILLLAHHYPTPVIVYLPGSRDPNVKPVLRIVNGEAT